MYPMAFYLKKIPMWGFVTTKDSNMVLAVKDMGKERGQVNDNIGKR